MIGNTGLRSIMYAEFVIPVGTPVYIWPSLDDFDKTIRGINPISGGVSGHVSWAHTKTELITNLDLVTDVAQEENNLYAVIYDPPTKHPTLGDVAAFAVRRKDLKTRDEVNIKKAQDELAEFIKAFMPKNLFPDLSQFSLPNVSPMTLPAGLVFYQDFKFKNPRKNPRKKKKP